MWHHRLILILILILFFLATTNTMPQALVVRENKTLAVEELDVGHHFLLFCRLINIQLIVSYLFSYLNMDLQIFLSK